MKKIVTIALFMSIMSINAFAKDSKWSLCKGDTVLFEENNVLIINTFEHRNATGDGRATDLTLLFGGWDLKGSVDTTDTNSAQIELTGKDSNFNGTIMINNYGESIEVKGSLKLYNRITKVNAFLKCELIRD